MVNDSPRYSIIVPVLNGARYLPSCISSILAVEHDNFELIISDDGSTDGTQEFLRSIVVDDRIRIFRTPHPMSMAEHWEFALSHARGDWCVFVGQDDGLQSYFFELADSLVMAAESKKIKAITSSRAYYFWPGCEDSFSDVAAKYRASRGVKYCRGWWRAVLALCGCIDYFELPQMYTNSLFHRDILDEARAMNGGRVFSCHPQDANLAAIAISLSPIYLKSYIPLGWVGTSPKSAGMSIVSASKKEDQDEEIMSLAAEYNDKVSKSALEYHERAGDFSLGSLPVYFWQALLMTSSLRPEKTNKMLSSKFAAYVVTSAALSEMVRLRRGRKYTLRLEAVLDTNDLSPVLVRILAPVLRILRILALIIRVFQQTARYVLRSGYYLKLRRNRGQFADLGIADQIVGSKVQKMYKFGEGKCAEY